MQEDFYSPAIPSLRLCIESKKSSSCPIFGLYWQKYQVNGIEAFIRDWTISKEFGIPTHRGHPQPSHYPKGQTRPSANLSPRHAGAAGHSTGVHACKPLCIYHRYLPLGYRKTISQESQISGKTPPAGPVGSADGVNLQTVFQILTAKNARCRLCAGIPGSAQAARPP